MTQGAQVATGLSPLERRVCARVAGSEDELVGLLTALIGFDAVVTHNPGAAPREEAALQHFLSARLAARGAIVSVEEPAPALVAGHPIHVAHTAIEHAPVADLVACTPGIAVAAKRFAGAA